jgi:esterase/lipase superfamily enzyme
VSDTPIYIQPDPAREPVLLYNRSYALVIGISNYTNGWRKLNNAVPDAEAIAPELEKQGFEVRLERDLNGADLAAVIDEWFKTSGCEEDVRLLMWFAGHGHTIERTTGGTPNAYIVGADAPNPDSVPRMQKAAAVAEFRRRSHTLLRFVEHMKEANARHVLVIFDSCFSGGIFAAARSAPPAINMYTSRPARQFITSGRVGQKVSDDGMFRRLFLEAITGESKQADSNDDGYVTANELGLYLQQEVTNLTESRQSPDFGSLREEGFDQGDFVFATSRLSSQTFQPPPIAQAESDAHEWLWILVRDLRRLEVTEAYLEKYPDTPFRLAAEAHIIALRKPQPITSVAVIDANATATAMSKTVFYATNRAVTPDGFGNLLGDELHLGKAVVSIPTLHRIGRIERPRNLAVWGVAVYQQSFDPLRHFTVLTNAPIAPPTLAESVNATAGVANSPRKEALVYIHGYNTSFNDALYRTSQLSYDMTFEGTAFLYSWPSAERVSQYFADVSNSEASERYLQEFIELLRSKCDFTYVHFLAHGLGVVPLMRSLNRMNATGPLACAIGEIILAAPDMNADLFENLCSTIRPLARGITVYASRNDKALNVAASLSARGRAGEIKADGPLVGPIADIIDVTAETDDLIGHSYFSGRRSVLADIRQLLASGPRPPPSKRSGLREIQGRLGTYWEFV